MENKGNKVTVITHQNGQTISADVDRKFLAQRLSLYDNRLRELGMRSGQPVHPEVFYIEGENVSWEKAVTLEVIRKTTEKILGQ